MTLTSSLYHMTSSVILILRLRDVCVTPEEGSVDVSVTTGRGRGGVRENHLDTSHSRTLC